MLTSLSLLKALLAHLHHLKLLTHYWKRWVHLKLPCFSTKIFTDGWLEKILTAGHKWLICGALDKEMAQVGVVPKYFEYQCISIRSKLENSSGRWPGEDQRGGGGLHGDGAGGAALPGAGAHPGVHGHHHHGGLPEHADSPQSVASSMFSSSLQHLPMFQK